MFNVAPGLLNTLNSGLPSGARRGTIRAMLKGWGRWSDRHYFFGDGYYTAAYSKTRKVDEYGYRPLARWGLTGVWANRVDAALNHIDVAKNGVAYLFKGGEYLRYNWFKDAIEGGPSPLGQWGLTGEFSGGIDAAINGQGAMAGKAYFFKGEKYARYDWKSGAVDQGPANIRDLMGEMGTIHILARDRTPGFVVLGAAQKFQCPIQYQDAFTAAENFDEIGGFILATPHHDRANAWVFDHYAPLQWGDPPRFVANGNPVRDVFPGVVETLQVASAAETAGTWINLARAMLAPGRPDATAMAALKTHFHVDSSNLEAFLPEIRKRFDDLREAIERLPRLLGYCDSARASGMPMEYEDAAGRKQITNYEAAGVPMFANPTLVGVTRYYPELGEMCRAAMVAHELVHVVDKLSGLKDTHISEFVRAYDAMKPPQAVHNPSAYSACAQQIFFGRDTRYGAGADRRFK